MNAPLAARRGGASAKSASVIVTAASLTLIATSGVCSATEYTSWKELDGSQSYDSLKLTYGTSENGLLHIRDKKDGKGGSLTLTGGSIDIQGKRFDSGSSGNGFSCVKQGHLPHGSYQDMFGVNAWGGIGADGGISGTISSLTMGSQSILVALSGGINLTYTQKIETTGEIASSWIHADNGDVLLKTDPNATTSSMNISGPVVSLNGKVELTANQKITLGATSSVHASTYKGSIPNSTNSTVLIQSNNADISISGKVSGYEVTLNAGTNVSLSGSGQINNPANQGRADGLMENGNVEINAQQLSASGGYKVYAGDLTANVGTVSMSGGSLIDATGTVEILGEDGSGNVTINSTDSNYSIEGNIVNIGNSTSPGKTTISGGRITGTNSVNIYGKQDSTGVAVSLSGSSVNGGTSGTTIAAGTGEIELNQGSMVTSSSGTNSLTGGSVALAGGSHIGTVNASGVTQGSGSVEINSPMLTLDGESYITSTGSVTVQNPTGDVVVTLDGGKQPTGGQKPSWVKGGTVQIGSTSDTAGKTTVQGGNISSTTEASKQGVTILGGTGGVTVENTQLNAGQGGTVTIDVADGQDIVIGTEAENDTINKDTQILGGTVNIGTDLNGPGHPYE